MARTKVALIGLGMAAPPHARSLIDLADRVEVAHAFSPSAERRRTFAAAFPFPLAGSVDAILGDRSVNAVVLLTPPNTHLDLVRACAAAGKHVLVEKPVEIAVARAEAAVAACREAGVVFGVVLQHRFRPSSERLAAIVAAGGLGAIVGAAADVGNWRPQSYYDTPGRGTYARDGGGVLLTQAIHTLDVLISVAGLPAEVSAYAATSPVHRMEAEDIVGAAMRFGGGAIGTIGATTAAYPGRPDRIDIVGTAGAAAIAGSSLTVHYHGGGSETVAGEEGAGGAGADPMAFSHEAHRALIADFLDAIERGGEPRVSGAEALKVHYLIDGLERSAGEGRPVRLRPDV